jgi:hypothetical protein
MDIQKELLWTLSAQGTLEQLRSFLLSGEPLSRVASTTGSVPQNVLRSREGLVQIGILPVTGNIETLVEAVRDHWAVLREKRLADANPVKIFATTDASPTVVYMFQWKNAESQHVALADPDVLTSLGKLRAHSHSGDLFRPADEVYQGFERRNFPSSGGIELLRGKCTCKISLDGLPGSVDLAVKNGFVIMHRGPQFIQSGSRLMPVQILAHGGDLTNPFQQLRLPENSPQLMNTPIRVEQNTELPQFGIIRANGPGTDFPATAMWVVHWKITTPMGVLLTDPSRPLVFGPTIVNHYPPVGTQFSSTTGPVELLNADTQKKVGQLIPGELTAFDIVVTLDDETPSLMDVPAKYYIEMFNRHVSSESMHISTEGLLNDSRIPPSFR